MQALFFLLDAVLGFFATLFLLRFLMQAMRVSFAGQLGSFVVSLTNWAVKPLRRVVPGFGGFDWASVVAAFALELVLAGALFAFSGREVEDPGVAALMIAWFAVRALLRLLVFIVIAALILQAVLSWINPYSPLAAPVGQLTRPMLAPIQRVLPLIAGVDLSPLVAILLLQVVLMFL